jgi:hypothetical protein
VINHVLFCACCSVAVYAQHQSLLEASVAGRMQGAVDLSSENQSCGSFKYNSCCMLDTESISTPVHASGGRLCNSKNHTACMLLPGCSECLQGLHSRHVPIMAYTEHRSCNVILWEQKCRMILVPRECGNLTMCLSVQATSKSAQCHSLKQTNLPSTVLVPTAPLTNCHTSVYITT